MTFIGCIASEECALRSTCSKFNEYTRNSNTCYDPFMQYFLTRLEIPGTALCVVYTPVYNILYSPTSTTVFFAVGTECLILFERTSALRA
jgi:hypothetical protein